MEKSTSKSTQKKYIFQKVQSTRWYASDFMTQSLLRRAKLLKIRGRTSIFIGKRKPSGCTPRIFLRVWLYRLFDVEYWTFRSAHFSISIASDGAYTTKDVTKSTNSTKIKQRHDFFSMHEAFNSSLS